MQENQLDRNYKSVIRADLRIYGMQKKHRQEQNEQIPYYFRKNSNKSLKDPLKSLWIQRIPYALGSSDLPLGAKYFRSLKEIWNHDLYIIYISW